MKHFRIKEQKEGKEKYYIIQYFKKLFFNLYIWKDYNNERYNKFNDALDEIKRVIKKDDYDTKNTTFHYIDALRIFRELDRLDREKWQKQRSIKINKSNFKPKN